MAAKHTGLVTLLMAVAVPPAVAGGLGQQFVDRHPVLTVAIVVAYEAAVAVLAFFAGVGQKLSEKWQTPVADRIDLLLQRKEARFARRYREFVLGSLRFIDHKDLTTVGPFTPELDAVFVNVELVSRSPQQVGSDVLAGRADEGAGRLWLDDFLGRELPVVLAVVGAPGSGKTTLLRHAARQAYLTKRTHGKRRGPRRDTPILLYLRDHAAAILADPAISVAALLRGRLGEAGKDEPPEWFERRLRSGRCIVLLDGLDEVPRPGDRAKVSAWAQNQVQQYRGNDFVISSRPRGYQDARVEGADIVQVCGFTAVQVQEFVHRWYLAAERHSTGSKAAEVTAMAEAGASNLLRRLQHTPALYDLAVNPLLLTMIANVHRYRRALPGSRADLYAEICQVILWRRQNAKGLDQVIDGDRKVGVLRGLAYTMMKRHVSDLSRADALAVLDPSLRGLFSGGWPLLGDSAGDGDGGVPGAFLSDVVSNGLLIERETGKYAFAHKTFQEYLASVHIREEGLVDELVATVGDDWWLETTLLYAAKSKADLIVEACLKANTGPTLALALDCLEPGNDVAPVLRDQVKQLVGSAADPDADPQLRVLLAAILLSRHTRRRRLTSGETQICLQPVQADLYRLFLADTRTPEPDGQLSESGTAVGIRGSDALAFAQWASRLSGGERNYRLPRAVELTELAGQGLSLVDDISHRPWVQPEAAEAEPSLWPLTAASDPFQLDSSLLADVVRNDVLDSSLMLNGLLLRSASDALAFARALGRDRNLDLDLARALDSVLNLNLNLNLNVALALALARAFDLDLDLARALARDLTLNLHLTPARARDLDLALISARNLTRDLTTYLARNITRDLTVDLAFDLTLAIDQAITHCTSPGFDDDFSRRALKQAGLSVTGSAFASSFEAARAGHDQTGTPNARLAKGFIVATGLATTGSMSADPAAMQAALPAVIADLTAAISKKFSDQPNATGWRTAMAERLQAESSPVFDRTERPTPEKAGSVRLAALCLAAEADQMSRRDLGEQLRLAATAITILEQRTTGERPPVEVIMLALAD